MAEIVGAHGVRGMVKLKVFAADPESLAAYGSFHDEDGKIFSLSSVQQHGNVFLAEIEGLKDRTAAEKLRGVKLFLDRASLPKLKKKNTYYHADLAGMTALYPDGKPLGRVVSVANFGAGDLLEIKPPKKTSFYVPFNDKTVPGVDLDRREITVDPPPGLLD